MLEVRNLRGGYGAVEVLRGVDLEIRAGEIVAAGLVQVPEGRRVFPDLTVRENLLLGGYRRGRPYDGSRPCLILSPS